VIWRNRTISQSGCHGTVQLDAADIESSNANIYMMCFLSMHIATHRGLEGFVGDQVHGKVWNEDLLARILVKVCAMPREGSRNACRRFVVLLPCLGVFARLGSPWHRKDQAFTLSDVSGLSSSQRDLAWGCFFTACTGALTTGWGT
jgi:hypothetical protein